MSKARPAVPGVIRVGGMDWTIVMWTTQQAALANARGQCDKDQLSIYLEADLPIQQEVRVLLHELLHAAWFVGALRDTEAGEELVVSALSFQLVPLIRDNPPLIKYLTEAFR